MIDCQPSKRQPTKGDALADRSSAHCGVGALVDLNGRRSHDLVQDALSILERLDHRGARGAEENTGDGAGSLAKGCGNAHSTQGLVRLPQPSHGTLTLVAAYLPAELRPEGRCRRAVQHQPPGFSRRQREWPGGQPPGRKGGMDTGRPEAAGRPRMAPLPPMNIWQPVSPAFSLAATPIWDIRCWSGR